MFEAAGDKSGRTFRFEREAMVGWATAAGFAELQHAEYKIPVGPWPRDRRLKEIGGYVGLNMDIGLDGYVMQPFGERLGWSLDECMVFVAKVRAAIRDGRNRGTGHL